MTEGQIFCGSGGHGLWMIMDCLGFEGKDERLGCKQSSRQDAEWLHRL